jgi:hypothetical protein
MQIMYGSGWDERFSPSWLVVGSGLFSRPQSFAGNFRAQAEVEDHGRQMACHWLERAIKLVVSKVEAPIDRRPSWQQWLIEGKRRGASPKTQAVSHAQIPLTTYPPSLSLLLDSLAPAAGAVFRPAWSFSHACDNLLQNISITDAVGSRAGSSVSQLWTYHTYNVCIGSRSRRTFSLAERTNVSISTFL